MQPPAGRLCIGDRVEVAGGQQGELVSESQIVSNGAWRYGVRLDDGTIHEHFDFELRPVS